MIHNILTISGVLLRKLTAGLRGVSHVIVDEIHERDINVGDIVISNFHHQSLPRFNLIIYDTDGFSPGRFARYCCDILRCTSDSDVSDDRHFHI